VSLVSRHLEANRIPTVVIGAARDVVEECGVARFLFSDFPLGNPCGKPYDVEMQRAIVGYALDLLETARLPRTTVQTPFRWSEDESWKANYARLDPERSEALRRAGERRRSQQASAKAEGRSRSS
jgi:D-proline reductase (dithiol) PrdB